MLLTRVIFLLLCATALAANVASFDTVGAGPFGTSWIFGDVDCDEDVDSTDALKVLQLHGGLRSSLPCQQNAYVDGDYDISSTDAVLILQYHARLLDHLPPLRRYAGAVVLASGIEADCMALDTGDELLVLSGEIEGISIGQQVETLGFINPREFFICSVGRVLEVVSFTKLS